MRARVGEGPSRSREQLEQRDGDLQEQGMFRKQQGQSIAFGKACWEKRLGPINEDLVHHALGFGVGT